jgi:predicted esterase
MTFKAKTKIQHGVGGDEYEFEAGDELPIDLFTKENLESLVASGAVEGDAEGYPETEDVDDDNKSDDEDVDPNTLNDADKDELKGLMDTPE